MQRSHELCALLTQKIPGIPWNFCDANHPLCATHIDVEQDDAGGINRLPVDAIAFTVIQGRTVTMMRCGEAFQAMLLNINVAKTFDDIIIVQSTPLMTSAEDALKALLMRSVDMLCMAAESHSRQQRSLARRQPTPERRS